MTDIFAAKHSVNTVAKMNSDGIVYLKVTKHEKKPLKDGKFIYECKVSDKFNFVRKVSVTFDADNQNFSQCRCNCKKGDICKHIEAMIRYYAKNELVSETKNDESTESSESSSAEKESDKTEKKDDDNLELDYSEPDDYLLKGETEKLVAELELQSAAAVFDNSNDSIDDLDKKLDDFLASDTCVLDAEIKLDLFDAPFENKKESEINEQLHEDIREMKIVFGNDRNSDEKVYWCPNDTEKVFHMNVGIIGTMGTGKTQFTKSLIAQLYNEQKAGNNYDGSSLGILIFDYKGDYNGKNDDFAKTVNANVLRPYRIGFNPLALNRSADSLPRLPLHTANTFVTTLAKIYNLGFKQQKLLKDCIMEAYLRQGISADDDSTWNRKEPTLAQVYEIFEEKYSDRPADSLNSALDMICELEIFERDPRLTQSLRSMLKGVLVIDLSGYDSQLQSLIVAITLDQFYAQMHAYGASKSNERYRQLTSFILVDEADSFMSKDFASMRKIMTEGREFGVGMILSTQSLKHFSNSNENYSKYILTWIIHNVGDLSMHDVEYVLKIESKSPELNSIYSNIKTLVKHQSVVKIANDFPTDIDDMAFFRLSQLDSDKKI